MKKLFPLLLLTFSIALHGQDLKPTATQALLKVLVLNDKNKPQVSQQVTFISQKDKKEYIGTTGADGKFSLLIPPATKYKVKYKVFTTVESDIVLEMPSAAGPYTFEYTITVTPPKTFTL